MFVEAIDTLMIRYWYGLDSTTQKVGMTMSTFQYSCSGRGRRRPQQRYFPHLQAGIANTTYHRPTSWAIR